MIIKTKCVFLKKGVDPKILEEYGFTTLNEGKSYCVDVAGRFDVLMWYADTRRFVLKYPKVTSARIIKRYIGDLFQKGIFEIKPFYSYLCIIGRWQNWSYEKLERIEQKLRKLNGMEERQ